MFDLNISCKILDDELKQTSISAFQTTGSLDHKSMLSSVQFSSVTEFMFHAVL